MRQLAPTNPITWQLLTGIIAPLVLFASIVGTFSVTQYRIGAIEVKQTMTDSKIEDIQDKTNTLTLDIAVIKSKLGVTQQTRVPLPASGLLLSLESKENTSGMISPKPTVNPNQSVAPTPTPTPTLAAPTIFKDLMNIVQFPL